MTVKAKDNSKKILAALRGLTKNEVLIGISSENIGRRNDAGQHGPINNAVLGYVHEFGSPARNIPARPFLRPGVASIRDEAIGRFKAAAQKAIAGDAQAVDQAMRAVGLRAQVAVRAVIMHRIPPPLSLAALESRLRRHPSRQGLRKEIEQRQAGAAPTAQDSVPLVDTGQMRNAITYVIRERK